MVLYHGTDYESGKNILQKGFGRGMFESVWDCSDPRKTYFIDKDAKDEDGLSFAFEAAQIAAAVKDSKETSIIIFELEIDEDDLYDDSSCRDWDNETEMPDCYQIDSEYLNKLIESGAVTMKAYEVENAYIPYLRIFYLPYKNMFIEYSDKTLEKAVKIVHESENYEMVDDLFYSITPKDLKKIA